MVDVDAAAGERRCRKRRKTFDADIYFASWRHNLELRAQIPAEKVRSPENCFSPWRQLFHPEVIVMSSVGEDEDDPVDIFSDWMPNLFDDDDDFLPDDHRLIKNKKRIQRKSHNLKRKRHF